MTDLTGDINQPDAHSAEAAVRWPEEFAESKRRLSRLTREQQDALVATEEAITQKASLLMKSGSLANSPEAQVLMAEHYRWVCAYWTPKRSAYIGLAEMYVSDERFKARYERVATGLAEFMREAMTSYANAHLS
ncbi:MAG: TipAS antibiotic-recognition domain-containing protein [Micrococcales bacterium]